jgi:hypothetical protein
LPNLEGRRTGRIAIVPAAGQAQGKFLDFYFSAGKKPAQEFCLEPGTLRTQSLDIFLEFRADRPILDYDPSRGSGQAALPSK